MNNKLIGRIRFWFINKPRHRRKKHKVQRPDIPYAGPAQELFYKMNRSGVMS